MSKPDFPSAAFDAWITKAPEVAEECGRCKCEPGVDTPCATQERCSCHWSKETEGIIAADEELATRKEEGR